MRTMTSLLVAAVLVAGAFAAGHAGGHMCTMLSGGNLFTSAGTCGAYTTCGTQFCACVGASSSGTTTPNACLMQAPNTTTCSALTTCMATYTRCIEMVPSASCSALNSTLKVNVIAAHTSGYFNSTLQRSCRNRVCTIVNGTSFANTCNFGTNDANVCMLPPMHMTTPAATTASNVTMAPNTTAMAMMTTTAAPTSGAPDTWQGTAIRATMVFGGNFTSILANQTQYNQLKDAIQSDLAGLLEVARNFVHIFRMTAGSLLVDFGVDTAAGVQPAVLSQRVNSAANNTSWLSSASALYTQITGDTMTVESVQVTVTLSPDQTGFATTTTAGPATTSSPDFSSASGVAVSALAAAFAALVAVAAL